MLIPCSICGRDISATKRVKNAQGHYFCPTCYAVPSSDPSNSSANTAPPPQASGLSDRAKLIIIGGSIAVALLIGISLYLAVFRGRLAASQEEAAASAARGVHGTVTFIIKGTATLFLNNKQIGEAKRDGGVLIPVTLRNGDVITVRATSSFVYRGFRLGFVPDTGSPFTFSGVKLLDGTPGTVEAAEVEKAPGAPKGRSNPEFDAFWVKAGLATQDALVGLPDKDRTFVFAVVVK